MHNEEYESKLKRIYKNIHKNDQIHNKNNKNFSEHQKMFREGLLELSKTNLKYFLNLACR